MAIRKLEGLPLTDGKIRVRIVEGSTIHGSIDITPEELDDFGQQIADRVSALPDDHNFHEVRRKTTQAYFDQRDEDDLAAAHKRVDDDKARVAAKADADLADAEQARADAIERAKAKTVIVPPPPHDSPNPAGPQPEAPAEEKTAPRPLPTSPPQQHDVRPAKKKAR